MVKEEKAGSGSESDCSGYRDELLLGSSAPAGSCYSPVLLLISDTESTQDASARI